MSKSKPRKKKCSSSGGEEEKVAGGHFLTKDNLKRKESSDVPDSQQQKEYPLPSNKDDSKSHRPIKKAVYKLSKKSVSEQIPVETDVGCKRNQKVEIPSREKTSSTQTKGDPSLSTARRPTEGAGRPHPRSVHTKDPLRPTAERTAAQHGPRIPSSQKGSSRSVHPAEQKHKPPSSHTPRVPEKACKRKADTATVTTTKPSRITSSSGKESTVRGGWKPLNKPYDDERGEPPRAKCSVRAPPHLTTEQSSTSKTQATSHPRPKRPTWTLAGPHVAPAGPHVAPGPPCVQGAGGPLTPQRPAVRFKIPKKTALCLKDGVNNTTVHNEEGRVSTQTTSPRRGPALAGLKGSNGLNPEGPVQSVHSTAVPPFISPQRGNDGSSAESQQPIWPRVEVPPSDKLNSQDEGASITTDDNDYEMPVVEALHQARTERRLEVDVVQSYGELTRMDTDAHDHGEPPPFKNELIVVLDTNILLSHLEYVKKILSHGLGAMGFAVVLIPWVVLQELDSLKNNKVPKGSVAHLAAPAVHFIYSCLKRQAPRLWGQSMQQASEGNRRLNAENNDDRILQCCLQYQILHPEGALILCTNDKNLCSKALLSGVRALCKADLEQESGRLHDHTRLLAPPEPPLGRPAPRGAETPSAGEALPRPGGGAGGAGGGVPGAGGGVPGRSLSVCVAQLEGCLKEVLPHILEVEMKAAFEDLWEDIVYVKPPWDVPDALRCMRRHWMAVFGNVVPRNLLQTLVRLCDFFSPGRPVDQASVGGALREAAELLDGFGKASYGGRLPAAAAALEAIRRRLEAEDTPPEPEPEPVPAEPLVEDAMMSEEKQAPPLQVSPQEVWAVFENLWTNLCQISSALFAALHFDPGTPQSPLGAPPPQDATACLHKLLPLVAELLSAFSRVLSSDMGMEESQALLSFIHASQMVSITAHLHTRDLVQCFSQPEYRERLKVGGAQLTELKATLECCVAAVNQSLTNTSWP
ncbi:unnamed protein product [Arctogadus glacialis]